MDGLTPYRFAIADHRLTVTHADGFPVDSVEVDNVVLGMGERYDVIVTAKSGAFAIVAAPEGKKDPAAEAVLRTVPGATPPKTGSRPAGLNGRALKYSDLKSTEAARLPTRKPPAHPRFASPQAPPATPRESTDGPSPTARQSPSPKANASASVSPTTP